MMDLMDDAEKLSFLWRIVRATESGALSWRIPDKKEGEAGDHRFQVRMKDFLYQIASVDNDDVAPYRFSVFRRDPDGAMPGKLRFQPVDQWVTSEFSPLNDALQAMYLTVKRRVLGYDNLVVDMFAALADVDGGPSHPTEQPELPQDTSADPWNLGPEDSV